MDKEVLPTGPERANIILIGEAPGEREVEKGVPFVGMAGKMLDSLLEEAGLSRSAVRITNVMRVRPPANKFSYFYEKKNGKNVPKPELQEAYARLKSEIASCGANVIVPLGNEALKAVTEVNRISLWRGSVIETPLGKVIPTYHPAAILRQWQFRAAAVKDFQRIANESRFPEVVRLPRDLIINPTFEEAMTYLQRLKGEEYCAFDIETETEQITCIGFAHRRDYAMCIPFWCGSSGSIWPKEQETQLWKAIGEVLESKELKKIAQNGSYDIEYLQRCIGIEVENFYFDTMLGFHTLYLELPKGLDFLTSIYTDHPYYKEQRKTHEMDELWAYNATDCALTYDIGIQLMAELKESNQWGFYNDYVHALVHPLLDMSRRGVRFDIPRRNQLKKEYTKDIEGLQERLNELVGHELNVNSPKQMTTWLYEELKLPKQMKLRKDTGGKTVAADNDALTKCKKHAKNEETLEAIDCVLAMRERKKLLSTYIDVKLDEDKRIRCSYNITGTETGRLSSSATASGKGTNLQNIPEGPVKQLFIPDEGKVFINADLSQAEARVVAYLCGDQRLMDVFEQGGDIHARNAANIFNLKEEEVTHEKRQLAKRVVHASNYGMGPKTFSSTAGISMSDARKLLNQYFATYPRIKLWHMQLKSLLQRARVLTTPFNRRRVFFNRWDEQLLKEGLAYIPQSTVADVLNQGLIELWEWTKDFPQLGMEVLLQVHDSIVVQVPRDVKSIESACNVMHKMMYRPIELEGKILKIPVDFKVGDNWDDMVDKEKYLGGLRSGNELS